MVSVMQQTTTNRAEENVSDWMPTCSLILKHTTPAGPRGLRTLLCTRTAHFRRRKGEGKAVQTVARSHWLVLHLLDISSSSTSGVSGTACQASRLTVYPPARLKAASCPSTRAYQSSSLRSKMLSEGTRRYESARH